MFVYGHTYPFLFVLVFFSSVRSFMGTVEWGESANIYAPLFAIVYASFFLYIELPDEVIKSTLLQIF